MSAVLKISSWEPGHVTVRNPYCGPARWIAKTGLATGGDGRWMKVMAATFDRVLYGLRVVSTLSLRMIRKRRSGGWAGQDSNLRHSPCKGDALPTELPARGSQRPNTNWAGEGTSRRSSGAVPRAPSRRETAPPAHSGQELVYGGPEQRLSDPSDIRPRRSPGRGELDRFGPYVVEDSIATGGMAQIYTVRHEDDPKTKYALKCIRPDCDSDPEFRRMLLDEARITGQLHHPNINRVLEVVRSAGRVALLLEHVDGIDLVGLKRQLRQKNEVLSLQLALHVLREVLDALDFAHSAPGRDGTPLNIVHRDVSPGNVMLDIKGQIILIDFGIARAHGRLAQTEVGSVKGKFRYMSPEQIKGADVGTSADIYAAGVLLWELLSGRRIHDDVPVAQLMMKVASADVPPLSAARDGLPDDLGHIYARATALVPQARFPSAGEFRRAIDDVAGEYDAQACRDALAKIALEGSGADQRRVYNQAVARARVAAEHDLEGAILDALEEPDRVERVDLQGMRRAEQPPPDDEDVTEFDPPGPLPFGLKPPATPRVQPDDLLAPADSE